MTSNLQPQTFNLKPQTSNPMEQKVTFEQLVAYLEDAKRNPRETCWQIYHYLKEHYKEDGSKQSRMLLMAYLRICPKESGRLHSCILTIACLMCQEFGDFKFDGFLKYWGYPQMLSNEDKQAQTGKDGRTYLSLRQRTDRLLRSYMLHHPESRTDENKALLDPQDLSLIMPVIAVKVFESERNGRKMKSAKLIGHQGKEFLADSHQLPCKPWEIPGMLFDVVVRMSKDGNPRIDEAVISRSRIADVFPTVTGYIDRYDADHKHYHVFDNLSRHFVAENPRIRPQIGDFVTFSPIIPMVDKFKSAIIHNILPKETGASSFGLLPATITYINHEKEYFHYELTGDIPTTPEGTIAKDGFANLSLLASAGIDAATPLPLNVNILLFLKRGKDGTKRNYVAQIFR